jgi:hypothetical protein
MGVAGIVVGAVAGGAGVFGVGVFGVGRSGSRGLISGPFSADDATAARSRAASTPAGTARLQRERVIPSQLHGFWYLDASNLREC